MLSRSSDGQLLGAAVERGAAVGEGDALGCDLLPEKAAPAVGDRVCPLLGAQRQ